MSPKARTQLVLSLLTLSLVANGVLLWREKAAVLDSGANPASTGLRPRTVIAPSPSTVAVATQLASSLDWESLAPADLNSFKAGLLAAGVAPELARVIIQARLAESVALRRAALAPEATSSAYWKVPEINAQLTVENAAELRQAARDNARLLKELFGDAPSEPSMQDIAQKAQYGSIPNDKVEQLRMIDDDYRDLQLIVSSETQLAMLPGDRDKLALLQRERLKDIKDTLTPGEFEEYQLRNSSVALGLRSTLDAFEPTEAEFKAIFALQQTFADQFPPATSAGDLQAMQATAQQRAQAQQQLTAQIKAALGPERAADYDKDTDFVYRNAQRSAQQLNLPKQAGEQLYTVQKDIQARATALRVNRNLGVEERNQQLANLETEATSRITSALGPSGLAAYQKLPTSTWITTLVPRPVAPPATAPAR